VNVNKSIAEISADTRLLYQRLLKLRYDEVVTYDELSRILGRDVRKSSRSNLTSARKMAIQDGIVTDAVRKVGIKRLTDERTVECTGTVMRKRIRRACHRSARRLTAVRFDNLSDNLKQIHNAELSQLGALAEFSKDKVTKRIRSMVGSAENEQLAIAQTLDAWKSE